MGVVREVSVYRDQVVTERFQRDGAARVGEALGIHWACVYRRAQKLGLLCTGNQKRAERNDTCNIHYFDEWSPNMAYVLGYLFADGSVARNTVTADATRSDEAILEFVRSEVSLKKPLKHYTSNNPGTRPFSRLAINSKEVVRRVGELGLLPRKTFVEYSYQAPPDEYFGHFLRGFFDGDGSASASDHACRISLIGSPSFIRGLVDQMIRLTGMKRQIPRLSVGKYSCWVTVHWSHWVDLTLFYHLVYPKTGFGFCLERKRQRIREWLLRPRDPRKCPPKHRRTEQPEPIM